MYDNFYVCYSIFKNINTIVFLILFDIIMRNLNGCFKNEFLIAFAASLALCNNKPIIPKAAKITELELEFCFKPTLNSALGFFSFYFFLRNKYFKIFIRLKNWLHCLGNLESRDISHERRREWAAVWEMIYMNRDLWWYKQWPCLTRFRLTLSFLLFLKFSKRNMSPGYNLNPIEHINLTWSHK